MPVVTALEAAQVISQDERFNPRNAGGRRLPAILPRLRRMITEDTLFIANVGPWPRLLETGSLKSFLVPAYDAAKDLKGLGYARSESIQAIFRTAKISTDEEYGYIEDDGFQVAWEALGVGHSLPPGNSIVKMGFFVPAFDDPNRDQKYLDRATPEEVQKAQRALSGYIDELIEEARDAYDKGAEERKNVISADRHLLAARLRGIDEPWVHHSHTQQNIRCAACGKYNSTGVAKCPCGTIIDFDLHFKIEAEQRRRLKEFEERQLEEATRPGKR